MRMQGKTKHIYAEAERDIRKKLDDFLARFKAEDERRKKLVDAGEMQKAEYDSWRRGQVFRGKRWQALRDEIVDQIYGSNKTAARIMNDERRSVFIQNANRMAYELEKKTRGAVSFELYDSATVTRLMKKDRKLLPYAEIKKMKDGKYNRKKVNNALTQSIIQGESMDKLAGRIAEAVSRKNDSLMYSFARTMMTGAQNAGRLEAMREARDMGIKLKKRWLATLDSRTRDTHRDLDGVSVDVDKPFIIDGREIMFPGDPNADADLVANCRCTLIYDYEDYHANIQRRDNETGEVIEWQTYREWEASKKGITTVSEEPVKPARTNNRFLTFDTEEDNKRLESQREENERLRKEYKQLDEEYWKSYDGIDKINAELAELDKLEKLQEQDYSYFDRFNSEEELKQRRDWISSKTSELYDKEEKLVRPRREDFANEDDYWAARMKWREDRDAITNERMELEKELSKAYDAPRGGWKGIEQWREARDTDEEILSQQREELLHKKEQLKERRAEILSQQDDINNKIHTRNEAKLVDEADKKGVQYVAPERLTEQPSLDTIVKRLGGGDETEGSCASLGFCYIGQKNGIDVLDFRDGASREMFSSGCRDTLRGIAAETGKPLLREEAKSGTSGAVRLLKQCKPGHEYYFVTGRHAAIVRKVEDHFEYLELQSSYKNGWKQFGEDEYYKDGKYTLSRTFTYRFGCDSKISGESLMMDVNDMKNSKLLQRSWGYMNTAENAQHKGASGHER